MILKEHIFILGKIYIFFGFIKKYQIFSDTFNFNLTCGLFIEPF